MIFDGENLRSRRRGTLGMVTNLEFLGIQLDADIWGSDVVGGDRDRRRDWRKLARLDASTEERRLFEEYGITSISADMALILAQDQGGQILHIDQGNVASALATLPYDQNIKSEIEAWVLAGGEADVPAAPLDFVQWSGVGYLLRDPATGEAKYQLAGGLSGGMTVLPPDLVPAELRDPLEYPSADDVNPDPASAVSIEIFDGNLQVAEVGSLLTVAEGHLPLRVIVRDSMHHPVKNVPVAVSLLGGGGQLVSGPTVTTGPFGVAAIHLRLGQHTVDAPYFGKDDPADEYLTQYGLNIVTASISSGVDIHLERPFYEFGKPGPLDGMTFVGVHTQTTFPNTSLPRTFGVLPRDRYQNPLSNVPVTFRLEDPMPSDSDDGTALLREQDLCRVNMIVGQECAGRSETVMDSGPPQGVQVRMIVGPDAGTSYQMFATATKSDGTTMTRGFVGTASALDLDIGEPLVIISRRVQPTNSAGDVVEAYAPGTEGQDLSTSLIVIEQQYTVESCPDCDTHWKIVGTGEYRTTRVKQGLTLPACAGGPPHAVCPGAEEPVTARMEYSNQGPGLTLSTTLDTAADEHGYFSSVPEIVGPGRYTVTATGRVNWRLPVVHADTASGDRPVEVYTDGVGALLGARLDGVEIPDGGVSIDSTIWGVEARVIDTAANPMPLLIMGHGNAIEEPVFVKYAIDPPDYPALETEVRFSEAGHVVLTATTLGPGPGEVTLGPGRIFEEAGAEHAAWVVVNRGWGWWMGSNLVRMGLNFQDEKKVIPTVQLRVEDILVGEGEDRVSVRDGEYDIKVKGPAEVSYRLVKNGCTADILSASLKVEYDAGNPAHADFYPNQEVEHGVTLEHGEVSVDEDPNPVPNAEGLFHIAWDGRDDTTAHRILLGGGFAVGVGVNAIILGENFGQTYNIGNHHWQEIAKPHSSNYGQKYWVFPGSELPDDATSDATIVRRSLSELADGSGFDTLSENAMLRLSASDVVERLQTTDAVMTFTGHSGPGLIQFCPDPENPSLGAMTQLATTRAAAAQTILPSVVLSDLPDGSLDDVLLVVLLACNTGSKAPDKSTLQRALLAKGVDTVIVFPGVVHEFLGRYWARRFWRLATQETTLDDEGCGEMAGTEKGDPVTIREAAKCAANRTVAYAQPSYSPYYVIAFDKMKVVPDPNNSTLGPPRYGNKSPYLP